VAAKIHVDLLWVLVVWNLKCCYRPFEGQYCPRLHIHAVTVATMYSFKTLVVAYWTKKERRDAEDQNMY